MPLLECLRLCVGVESSLGRLEHGSGVILIQCLVFFSVSGR